MKLRKLLGECCPQYSKQLEDVSYQKVQKVLTGLRTETNSIKTTVGWSRKLQKQLDEASIVDVSEVGEKARRHGRMSPDKFKTLTKDQRDHWVEFNDKLFDVAEQIIRDTEASVQTLSALKDILALVVEPLESFSKCDSSNHRHVSSLRERYFKFVRSTKSEGRIRLRYLRIFQDSQNPLLFQKWNEQLQNELKRSGARAEELNDFLSEAKKIVDAILRSKSHVDCRLNAEKHRHDLAIIKSKKDILEHRWKVSEEQANSWAERAGQAERDNKSDAASESERRRKTFEIVANLYQECFGFLEEIYKHLSTQLEPPSAR